MWWNMAMPSRSISTQRTPTARHCSLPFRLPILIVEERAEWSCRVTFRPLLRSQAVVRSERGVRLRVRIAHALCPISMSRNLGTTSPARMCRGACGCASRHVPGDPFTHPHCTSMPGCRWHLNRDHCDRQMARRMRECEDGRGRPNPARRPRMCRCIKGTVV